MRTFIYYNRTMKLFLNFLLLTLLTTSFSEEHSFNGTVYFDSSSSHYSIKLGVVDCENGISCGSFQDTLNKTGWGVLDVRVDSKKSPQVESSPPKKNKKKRRSLLRRHPIKKECTLPVTSKGTFHPMKST